jgi:hypothetical protein
MNTSEQLDTFIDDLLAERGTRPLIIVGASKVDDILLEILRGFLLPKIARSNNQDELLEGESPLGTFSARIRMCRRLGLIDQTLFSALDRLRIIRNLCAHSISFDDARSPVREHFAELRKLVLNREPYRLTKDTYFDRTPLRVIEEWQCLLLTLCILLEAIRTKLARTADNIGAMRFAGK